MRPLCAHHCRSRPGSSDPETGRPFRIEANGRNAPGVRSINSPHATQSIEIDLSARTKGSAVCQPPKSFAQSEVVPLLQAEMWFRQG